MAPATEDLGHDRVPLLQIKCMYYLTDCRAQGRGSSLLVPTSNGLPSGPIIGEGELDPLGAVEVAIGPATACSSRTEPGTPADPTAPLTSAKL